MAVDRPLQAVILLAAVVATAATAAPGPTSVRLTGGLEAAASSLATPEEVHEVELVWNGQDVDGDGQSDFVNPTGQAPREHDAYGEGAFGASRDGGARRHEGVDFIAEAGQAVAAPISGYVTKIGMAYAGDNDLKFIEITNPAIRYAVRVFYVDPIVQVGDAIALGRTIGTAHSLQRKYPEGMTDHVHLEVLSRGGRRIDAERVITASYRRVASGG